MRCKRHDFVLPLLAMMGLGLCLSTAWAQDAGATAPPPPPEPPPETRLKASSHWRLEAWGKGEEVVKLLEKLKTENPQEYQRLEELRKTDVEKFFREVRSKLPRRSEFISKIGLIEQKCRDLSRDYRAAKGEADKARVEAELRTALKESFDTVISDAHARIERLQKQVGDMQANEMKILTDRLQMFLSGEHDGAAPPPPPAP